MSDDIHDRPTGDVPTGDWSPGEADVPVEFRESFEAVLDRFEAAWQSGEPEIAEYARARPGDEALLVELCLVDLEHRRKRGLPAALEAYTERFPALADRLRELAAGPAATAPFLRDRSAASLVGREIGDVTIVRLIGEGGMGRVYEGRQRKPRRPVAVKVMQPGVASPALLKRFEYEAQVLARLRHPGIAHIYAVGTHEVDGESVPYFVMEYIPNAQTLTQYAEERKLSTHERLELFRKVCDAVAHGHQKGVIHRDLKPANVVVDSTGQPKVIDFGVAKATGSDLALTTMQTDVGAIIGTLQYMSPEQFDADPDDLDVRLDVYALGVVLYELLTGKPPYDVRRKAIYEVARVVREEEPTPITSLDRTLRRDVAVIAGKCLEKDRDRRYSSAAELAGDVGRYLAGEPIAAAPPSLWDGIARLARRHKAAAVAVAGVAASLVAAVVGISAFAIRAERAREEADRSRQAEATERQRAERLLRVSTAQRLAVASQQAQDSGFVPRGILLGVAAVRSTTRLAEPVVPEAEQALRSGLAKMPKGTRYSVGEAVRQLVTSPEPVEVDYPLGADPDDPEAYEPKVLPAFSPEPARARWLVAAGTDSEAFYAWDLLRQPRSMQRIVHDVGCSPESLALSADGRWLVASFANGTVGVWDLTGETPEARHRFTPTKPDRALCTAISPDGRRLAAGFMSGEIRLWDLADKDPATTSWVLPGHTEAVQSLQIDYQARLLASQSQDETVRVWDLTRRSAHEPIKTYHVKQNGLDSFLVFNKSWGNNRSLLASSEGPLLWDLSDAASPDGLDLDGSGSSPVVFHDDWLLGVGYSNAHAWDLRDHEGEEPSSRRKPRRYDFGGKDANLIVPAVFDADRGIFHDCFLASGRTVQGWSLPREPDDKPTPGEEVYCGHDDDVSALAASHDGAFLFTGGKDGAVQIWELGAASDSGQAGFMVPGFFSAGAGSAPRLSADGRWLFIDRRDDSSRYGSLPPNTVLDLAQNPPREVVLDVVATTANTPPPAPENAAKPGAGRDESLVGTGRFCSRGSTLVAAVKTPGANQVLAWNLTTGGTAAPRVLIEDTGPERLGAVLAASPDLRWLVSEEFLRISDEGTRSEGSLKLWHLAGPGPPAGRVLPTKDFSSGDSLVGEPTLIEFSPDGRWLVLGGGDSMQRLLLFDLGKSDEDPVLDLRPVDLARFAVGEDRVLSSGQFSCTTFSPDGRWLYVSDIAEHLFRIDLGADRPQDAVVAANVAAGDISRITPSADGRWIGCCLTRNNAVAVWDARTFAQDAQPTLLMGHEQPVDCLAFGGETRLASGSGRDETVRLWDLAPLQRGGSPTCQVFEAGSGVNRVGFAANGSVLLAVTNEGVRGWPLGVDSLVADALERVGRDLTAEERANYAIDFELAP